MHRVTISLDEGLASAFDALSAEQGYKSRSEAVRDLVRQAVEGRRIESSEDGRCVASLSYIFDHHTRALSQRLTELQHDHHDIVVTTTHVHLDHDSCIENTILRGTTKSVLALADAIKSERGVRFANINLVSVLDVEHDKHGHDGHTHGPNEHYSPNKG